MRQPNWTLINDKTEQKGNRIVEESDRYKQEHKRITEERDQFYAECVKEWKREQQGKVCMILPVQGLKKKE